VISFFQKIQTKSKSTSSKFEKAAFSMELTPSTKIKQIYHLKITFHYHRIDSERMGKRKDNKTPTAVEDGRIAF